MSAELAPIPLPDLASIATARLSAHTQRAYSSAIRAFLARGAPLARESIQNWLAERKAKPVGAVALNVGLAAIKLLAREAWVRGLLDPNEWNAINDIRGEKVLGQRLGRWIDEDGIQKLLSVCDTREKALIAVLCGAGLRRSELCALKWSQLQEWHGRMVLVDIRGKGGRVRSVAVPDWAAELVDAYKPGDARDDAPMFQSLARSGTEHQIAPDTPLSPAGVMAIVARIAERADMPGLAPHDLRRSFARLARDGGADYDMIRHSLGHSSVATTERYVNSIQDLRKGKTAGDHIRIRKRAAAE